MTHNKQMNGREKQKRMPSPKKAVTYKIRRQIIYGLNNVLPQTAALNRTEWPFAFSVLSGGTKLFKHNHGHYKKVCLLADVSCGSSVGGDPHQHAGAGSVCISEPDFNKLVYCVLLRYHSVLGHGFQMTLDEQAFNVLRAWFNVWFECFASPLNCNCSAYALAFPLMDWCFGVMRNFFSLCPSSGSFKANPLSLPRLCWQWWCTYTSCCVMPPGR